MRSIGSSERTCRLASHSLPPEAAQSEGWRRGSPFCDIPRCSDTLWFFWAFRTDQSSPCRHRPGDLLQLEQEVASRASPARRMAQLLEQVAVSGALNSSRQG